MLRTACVAIAIAAACTPIKPVPLSSAPVNSCPCDGYDATQSKTAPRCQNNSRCEISTAGNRPEVPFWIVVNVPETSVYAAGSTFVLFSDEKGSPTFTRKAPAGTFTKCQAPSCVELPGITSATGVYGVSATVSFDARYPLDDNAKIPVDVRYVPTANSATDITTIGPFPGLPIEPTIAFPRLGINDTTLCGTAPSCAEYAAPLPSGLYSRVLFPQAPFDALFPPRIDTGVQVGEPGAAQSTFLDRFELDSTSLDPDVNGRTVTVTRDEGLDGWQVSLVDSQTNVRISTLKTLSGTSAKVQLDTTGQLDPTTNSGLNPNAQVVISPPASFIGVPTYVTDVNGGEQFAISFPFVPDPKPVVGVVAEPTTDAADADAGKELLGYQAHVTFESASIYTPRAVQETSPLLQYTTNVDTDERGQFSTVLPAGIYNVTTEPAEGTGFAKSRAIVVVAVGTTKTALTLQPPRQTKVSGRALLSDKRPLADADILAIPQTPTSATTPKPRPGHSHTENDGSYQLLLDEGPYVLTFVPKVGSGFPRVVTRTTVQADTAELPDVIVPPPTAFTFAVWDPRPALQVPVQNAIVRIFTLPGIAASSDIKAAIGAGILPEPVEIGEAMTDANGQVEILLAPSPK